MKKVLIIVLVCLSFIVISFVNIRKVDAATPYITQTANRYDELVDTQEAYEPIKKIKDLGLNVPKDLFIDNDDILYICDTGNKQIVISNEEKKEIIRFGNDLLIQPTGIYVRDVNNTIDENTYNKLIYIADYGFASDNTTGRIYIYLYNSITSLITFKEALSKPTSVVLDIDNFIYRPTKIAVDSNLTMYVVVEGSYNGILMVNSYNRFMSYFAPNGVETSLKDQIKKFIYGDNEKANLTKNLPPAPYNVSINDSGYLYTVTQTKISETSLGNTLKKVNIGGLNFYPAKMHVNDKFVCSWSGKVGNVFAVCKNGFIYEYDIEGNLLFVFSGSSGQTDQLGLFNSASAIAVDSNDNLYVLDDNDGSYQIFQPTDFANKVHVALDYYNKGQYIESKELWEDILQYNAMYDLAHKSIGLAYFLNNDFEKATDKFVLANAKEEYSDAYWQIRNLWLTENAGWIICSVIVIIIIVIIIKFINRKTGFLDPLRKRLKTFFEMKWIHNFFLMFGLIKKPIDTCYYMKKDKSISYVYPFIFLLLLFGIYLLGITKTGFIFNTVIIERTILLKEVMKIIIPVIAFVIANYLASSLLEGEGSFKAICLSTLASFAPVIIMYPIIIWVSNYLTLNESFIYYFGLIIMIGWSAILLFISNKEIHNYSLGRNILNFILSLLLMIVLIIVVILIYLIIMQIVNFVSDIITEVIFRD